MSDSTLWFVVLSSTLAAVFGVATFFIQKWISSVDETIKEHNTVIYKISAQTSSLQSMQSSSSENISEAIRVEIGRGANVTSAKLFEIRQEVGQIKDVLQTKVLPHIENTKIQLGKVIVIEKEQIEQGKTVTKLYENLKTIIEKLPRQK